MSTYSQALKFILISMHFLTLVLLSSMSHAQDVPANEVRRALIVYNTIYTNWDKLPESLKTDANDLATALRAAQFEVIVQPELNSKTFGPALDEFLPSISAGASDGIYLFYFSGHGFSISGAKQEQGNEDPNGDYIALTDSETGTKFPFGNIKIDRIADRMRGRRGLPANVLIFDACRDDKTRGSGIASAPEYIGHSLAYKDTLMAWAGPPKEPVDADSHFTKMLTRVITKEPIGKLTDILTEVSKRMVSEGKRQPIYSSTLRRPVLVQLGPEWAESLTTKCTALRDKDPEAARKECTNAIQILKDKPNSLPYLERAKANMALAKLRRANGKAYDAASYCNEAIDDLGMAETLIAELDDNDDNANERFRRVAEIRNAFDANACPNQALNIFGCPPDERIVDIATVDSRVQRKSYCNNANPLPYAAFRPGTYDVSISNTNRAVWDEIRFDKGHDVIELGKRAVPDIGELELHAGFGIRHYWGSEQRYSSGLFGEATPLLGGTVAIGGRLGLQLLNLSRRLSLRGGIGGTVDITRTVTAVTYPWMFLGEFGLGLGWRTLEPQGAYTRGVVEGVFRIGTGYLPFWETSLPLGWALRGTFSLPFAPSAHKWKLRLEIGRISTNILYEEPGAPGVYLVNPNSHGFWDFKVMSVHSFEPWGKER